MKKATPNLNHVPAWDQGVSDSYIRDCYGVYQEKYKELYYLNGSYTAPHYVRYYSSVRYHYTGNKINWNLIDSFYREGRSDKVLNCDYGQFADIMINGYQYKWTAWSRLEVPFRHKHDQVKWKEKGKKEVSEKEQARRDWREKKGINRDNKKASWRRRAGKWCKNQSQRYHRAWEKENISKGNWDDLANDKSLKYFQDSWMWD